ncbi:MAG: disulfide bond formation protein B [Proteobacteria bacterium]|nr:disulfide bond formation protein B [Pseudomonadota bacterium]
MKKLLEYLSARWGLFYMGVAAAVLGAAYFFQYVLGYQPCELCLYQRYPYMIIAVVALIAYVTRHRHDIGLKRAARGFLIIIIMLLFLEVFLAAHHIGVEQGFWQAFTACAGIDIDPSATTEEYLRFLSEIQVIACDQRRTFLGISFAEYNIVIATFLTAFGIYTYNRTK